MSDDDSNDAQGEPGACPGHDWEVRRVELGLEGGSLLLGCVWCGALQWEIGENQRKAILGDLDQ
ncbi:hypothetical protein [Arthrobacter woluwensis]|uniref:hypothetical protein n=1 Tax=Arthrobacter woluwensis TaxID=156980 RepID=UPI0011B2489E|nr:hypothetical protein [Arthrobacter woluwensis]